MTGDYRMPIGAHRAPEPESEPLEPTLSLTASRSPQMFGGDEDLEVVGEASYQDALWAICGGWQDSRVRKDITATMVPEPDNEHDPNAIAVYIQGEIVGHLARDNANQYLPGLRRMMDRCRIYVALKGVIVGGGFYDNGPGRLGVWLDHDPRDFGLASSRVTQRMGPAIRPVDGGTMRTGFSEAWLTDVDDDSYDLSWFTELPKGDRPAIAKLREWVRLKGRPGGHHHADHPSHRQHV